MTDGGRIAVCVSGQGSNLRALVTAARRELLGGSIVRVVADRPCPALEYAAAEGIATAIIAPADHADRTAWDAALADALAGVDAVVLAGFMRVLGPQTLDAFPGRILNVHPSLLPSFPGADAIGDALAAGAKVTGVTVHLVDATLDGGPIVAQEAVAILPDDDAASLAARIHAVEHRLLSRTVALLLGGGLRIDGVTVSVDPTIAAGLPTPRRALISVSDKQGLDELGKGLAAAGFELVSTGGTARALRVAGLEVTDVAAVTGFPEMLDGRVKTLHPAISAGVLADQRSDDHRAQLAAASIDPFEVVVVNLYPFAEASRREGISAEELIEEIDIGGPTLVRAAAKNHASVTIVTDPADYERVLQAVSARGGVPEPMRRELAVAAFAHTAAYDAMIASTLPTFLATSGAGEPSASEAFPERLDLHLVLERSLRYGENPHQRAASYRWQGAALGVGPFAGGVRTLQGKELSYNNILDASAAAGLARDLRGAAVAIVKHTNPCGAAEADDLLSAWDRALAGDPVSAFGGVVAVRGDVDGPLAERLTSLFLEVVVARSFDEEARAILATKPNLRLVDDPEIVTDPAPRMDVRTSGGAVLMTDADRLDQADEPASWTLATSRGPTDAEAVDLSLAWRVVRHVVSNAIVLAQGSAIVGVGSGQMSRVDSARHAVEKAGPDRARGAACASDAFFPFPDGVEACLSAGVTAFVQPGGSQRDAEVIAAVERSGATMLLTGRRHFRH